MLTSPRYVMYANLNTPSMSNDKHIRTNETEDSVYFSTDWNERKTFLLCIFLFYTQEFVYENKKMWTEGKRKCNRYIEFLSLTWI